MQSMRWKLKFLTFFYGILSSFRMLEECLRGTRQQDPLENYNYLGEKKTSHCKWGSSSKDLTTQPPIHGGTHNSW